MPEEIIVAVREHNFSDYDGKHAIYAKLVNLANQLLQLQGEDKDLDRLGWVFTKLELDMPAIQKALETVQALDTDLDQVIEELVA